MNYFTKTILLILALFITHLQAISQGQPTAKYSYDNCTLVDDISTYPNGVDIGGVSCECGVVSQAMGFDGQDDCVQLDSQIKSLFSEDFSLSLYFFSEVTALPAPIFAIKDTCSNRDSSFVIRYLPTEEIEVIISENIADRVSFRENIDPNRCWNHIAVTKSGDDYNFFLNGDFIDSKTIARVIPMGARHVVELGNSSCVSFTDQKFEGKIDEFLLFDRALKAEEIIALDIEPDRILSADTTIFEGNQVLIEFEGSCGNISWSPTTNLTNSAINPVASPSVTTSYMVTSDHGSCITRDAINIIVVSDEDIKCNNLLLPDAFTPNGDGLNDLYGISNVFIIEELINFSIFDRWGGLMYSSNRKDEKWDGFYSNTAVNSGMFVYRVEYTCKGENFEKVGNFSILR